MNTKVVYTCIFGEGYTLNEPIVENKDWDFICYTDQDFVSERWSVVRCDGGINKAESIEIYRFRKIFSCRLPLRYKISMYVYSNFVIKQNLNDYYSDFLCNSDYDALFMLHNKRSDPFAELDFLCKIGKITKSQAETEKAYYHSRGLYKSNTQLYAAGIILRRPWSKIRSMESVWHWRFLCGRLYRDQPALSYALSKFKGINILTRPFCIKDFLNGY